MGRMLYNSAHLTYITYTYLYDTLYIHTIPQMHTQAKNKNYIYGNLSEPNWML